jgi:hypothetical protein
MPTGTARGAEYPDVRWRRATALCGVALLVIVLAGCAAGDSQSGIATGAIAPQATAPNGQATASAEANAQVAPGKARLLLARPNGMLYAAAPARVKVGEEQVASLWPGASAVVDVPAGTSRISVDSWNYPGEWADDVPLADGQTYRIEVAPREDGVATALMFGAIGGAFEASSNATRSGLFQLKMESASPPARTASATPPAPSSGR